MNEPVLRFSAAGMPLGVFLADVGRVLLEGALVRVPFSHPAMVGLLTGGPDGPVPVFDLAALDPEHPTRSGSAELAPGGSEAPGGTTVALFPTPKGPAGLRIDRLAGTINAYVALDASDVMTLHDGVSLEILKTLTGAARTESDVFSFFSPEAFLAGLGL